MNHIYIIGDYNTRDILFSRTLFEQYCENITSVNCMNHKFDERLTEDIQIHLDNINQLTIEKFNWLYYVTKYTDLTKIKNKQDAWDHWSRYGLKENRNPIDRKTISDLRDTNF